MFNMYKLLPFIPLVLVILISGCIQGDQLQKFESDTNKFQEEANKLAQDTDTASSAYNSQMEPDIEENENPLVQEVGGVLISEGPATRGYFLFLDEDVVEESGDFRKLKDTEVFGKNVHARIISFKKSDPEMLDELLPIVINIENGFKKEIVIDNSIQDCYDILTETGCSKNIGTVSNSLSAGKLVMKAVDKNGDLLAYIEYKDGVVINRGRETIPGIDY